MANAIAEGISAAGGTAAVMSVEQCSPDQVNTYSKIAFGCPSMGDEVLEESEFEPFFEQVETSLLCLVPMTGEPASGWRTGVTA